MFNLLNVLVYVVELYKYIFIWMVIIKLQLMIRE